MRLVSLTGATSVTVPGFDEAHAGPDGVFDVPNELGAQLIKHPAHWRTEAAHAARQASKLRADMRNPRKAADILASIQVRLAQVESENARLRDLLAEHGIDDTEPEADDDPVDLTKLTVAELKALAADRGVELGDARTKADIIAVLDAAAQADAPA